MSMGLDEWDLPSDAAMLRWVEERQATVAPIAGRWEVRVARAVSAHLVENVIMGVGNTVWEALESAMRNEVENAKRGETL